MSAQKSCTELEAGEGIFLCKMEGAWKKTVADIQLGFESLCLALQKFLLILGHNLESIGEDNEIDVILASVGRADMPDGKELTELEAQSLKILDQRWSDFSGRFGRVRCP